MTPATIMTECQESGVTLSMDAQGGLSCRGDQEAVTRLLPAIRQHKPALLRILVSKCDPSPPPTDLDSLAADIAAEFHVTTAAALGLLDDDDRRDIEGGDEGMVEAWRTAVRSLLHRGVWRRNDTMVRCCDCGHALPAAPGMVDCSAGVRAPGCCGPVRWWDTDPHVCDRWEARA